MEISAPIVLFAASTAITPGPNNAMIMASGLNHGVRGSLPHFLGINIGFTMMVVFIGFGMGAVLEGIPILHRFIRIFGVLYLLYLAWLIATTATSDLDHEPSKPLSFWQAALFQWVNPKAWVMVTGAMSAYTSPAFNIYGQVLMIASIFFVVGTPCSAVWMLGGVSLKQVLRAPKRQKAFNVIMALLLVISICPVVIELFN